MSGMMVKTELTESCSAACRGCLSTDRRLSPLINYKLYFSLLSEKQKLEVMMESEILVCWECNALMRKMMAFQMQAQEAHMALENFTDNAKAKTSLSQLTICEKQNYDVIIDDTTDELKNELSDCHILDAKDFKEEIIDDTIEHKTDEDNVLHMDISSEYFDANGDESCVEEFDNLSLEQGSAANCIIKTKIKVRKLKLPVRERLQRAVKTTLQQKPISTTKRKRKTKKNKTSKKKIVVRIPIQNIQKPVKIDNNVKVQEVSGVESDDEGNQNLDPDFEIAFPKVTDKTGPSTAIKGKHNNVQIKEEVCETESDDEDNQNSDPDFEIESSKVTDKSGQPKGVKRKHKYKKCYKKKEDFEMCRTERFKYSFHEVDTFFTELTLSEGEIASALEKQPSYKTEEYKFECTYCGLCFTFNHTLEKHKRMCHRQLMKSLRCKDPSSPSFYRYRMLRCGACFAVLRAEHAAAHMKYSHVWRFFCTQCREVFWDKDQMKAHWTSSHWPYRCDDCDAALTSKWLLVKHLWQHHRATKPFRCSECGARFVSPRNTELHRARMHARDHSAPELRYCVQCDKHFPTIHLYELHLRFTRAHNVKKTYPCPACDKVLSTKGRLKEHYSHFHTDSALYPCPHCQKGLAHRNALKEHVNRVHLKIQRPKDKICPMCGRGFGDNKILRHHILTHTGERPHACALCPAAFTQKHSLRTHIATRHKDEPGVADP